MFNRRNEIRERKEKGKIWKDGNEENLLSLSLSLLEYLYITNEAIDFDAYRDLCPKDFHGLVLIQSTGGQQGFGGGVVKSFGLLSLLLLLLHIGKRNDR